MDFASQLGIIAVSQLIAFFGTRGSLRGNPGFLSLFSLLQLGRS